MSRRVIIDEIDIEVPYGKITAKTWHEETDDCKRILALHGWMDNCGSFDNLLPHIKYDDDLYIVALDLPGHGRSSQLPPGSSYCDLTMVMEIRRCVRELGWAKPVTDGSQSDRLDSNNSSESKNSQAVINDNNVGGHKKFSIIGHSLGAGLGLYYCSLYPNDVDEIILLDFMKSRTIDADLLLRQTAETIDRFIETVPSLSPYPSPILSKLNQGGGNSTKYMDKGQVIVSQEAAIVATIDAHKTLGVLTREDATCLLKRSTVAVSTPPNSVIYSRDLRLNCMLNMREHWEVNKIMFSNVRCHVICLLGKEGLYTKDEFFKDKMDMIEEYLKTKAKTYYVQWIEGGDHYLHMNRSKQAAEIINNYLRDPEGYKITAC